MRFFKVFILASALTLASAFSAAAAQRPDSLRFKSGSEVPDSLIIRKIEEMNSYITIPYNATVKQYINQYTVSYPAKLGKLVGMGEYYLPLFEEVFDRYDMPLELKMMAVIESALVPTARSKAGAAGMWQFMYRTGKLYGLRINSFVDERLDPVQSADAAARYLLDAYKEFGDWNLAISAYNCGSGNVRKAIARSGSREFWDIYPFLPKETRSYVPAFVGALYGFTYYKDYGIEPVEYNFPTQIDTFEIRRNVHFNQIHERVGVSVDTLRLLNPQYKHDIIPGNEDVYILRIPSEYSDNLIAQGDSVYTHNASKYLSEAVMKSIREGGDGGSIRYKVKAGDTLSAIGVKYHCKVSELKKWNNLKSDNLRIGQLLLIYTR